MKKEKTHVGNTTTIVSTVNVLDFDFLPIGELHLQQGGGLRRVQDRRDALQVAGRVESDSCSHSQVTAGL